MITKGEVGGGRVDERLEFTDVSYLHIWINKVLLYTCWGRNLMYQNLWLAGIGADPVLQKQNVALPRQSSR